ncbi:hypothetical protein QJQ45_001425 [Haematococcus lacustris]|nr:hypothetical protein QJQ45_001425 [Haematococcus lacustris]
MDQFVVRGITAADATDNLHRELLMHDEQRFQMSLDRQAAIIEKRLPRTTNLGPSPRLNLAASPSTPPALARTGKAHEIGGILLGFSPPCKGEEEWLLGPWAHLQLDPQVWGMGTTTLLDFSVKLARVRLHQLQRVSADPLDPPSGGLWTALWGVRPPRAAGEPEVAAVADGALRQLELKWEASAQQVAGQGAAGEREQQGRDVEERLPEEAGQPCAKVWKELLDPTLRREHVIVAWRVFQASLMVGAL